MIRSPQQQRVAQQDTLALPVYIIEDLVRQRLASNITRSAVGLGAFVGPAAAGFLCLAGSCRLLVLVGSVCAQTCCHAWPFAERSGRRGVQVASCAYDSAALNVGAMFARGVCMGVCLVSETWSTEQAAFWVFACCAVTIGPLAFSWPPARHSCAGRCTSPST